MWSGSVCGSPGEVSAGRIVCVGGGVTVCDDSRWFGCLEKIRQGELIVCVCGGGGGGDRNGFPEEAVYENETDPDPAIQPRCCHRFAFIELHQSARRITYDDVCPHYVCVKYNTVERGKYIFWHIVGPVAIL